MRLHCHTHSVHIGLATDCNWVCHFNQTYLSPNSAAITKTITVKTQRESILLVELLYAEYAHAHSTNGMCSLCVVIVIIIRYRCSGTGP